jgi:hypothetical protein
MILDVFVPILAAGGAAGVAVVLIAVVHAWRALRATRRGEYEGLADEGAALEFVAAIEAAGDAGPVRTAARYGISVPSAEPTPAVAELRFTRVELFTRGAELADAAPHPIFDQLAERWARLQGAAADYVRFEWPEAVAA